MVEDLAHTAYEAAQGGELDAMHDAVTEILIRGPFGIDTAVQAWMDRTIVMIGHVLDGRVRLKIAMISDHSGTGLPELLQQVRRPDVAWAGQLFLAHAERDRATWAALWAAVPAGQIRLYVERVLTTMAVTALAYEEGRDSDDDKEGHTAAHDLVCNDPIHRMVAADRRAAGRRLAKAHLN